MAVVWVVDVIVPGIIGVTVLDDTRTTPRRNRARAHRGRGQHRRLPHARRNFSLTTSLMRAILKDVSDELTPEEDLGDLSPKAIVHALPDAQQDAANEQEADAEAQAIYAQILNRNPEHDFEPTIERVESLMELLGDPQHSFRAIHITGTNGKSSTARMVESLLKEMGLRTGRFTSPHLHTVRERIAIDGEPISAARFVEVWQDIEPYVTMVDEALVQKGQSRLSFFEVLTGFAYAAFADTPVDVAVIEVGMGGEWDSTNVVDADVAVFTPIARDHEKWLGSDLQQIAAIKSGIIKNTSRVSAGQVVVTAEQPSVVEPIIAENAQRDGARVLAEGYDLSVADRQVAVGGQLMALQTPAATYTEIFLPLLGAHQSQNALLALVAVEAFLGGGALPADVVEAGFAAVLSPARMEVVRSSPTVVIDAGHNPAGVKALVEAVEETFAFSRLVGVVGVMADKDADGIFAELEPLLDEVVITQSTSMRSMDVDDLAEIAEDTFDVEDVHRVHSLPDAIALAADLSEQGQRDQIATGTGVLVVGSVFLAGEVRTLFGHR